MKIIQHQQGVTLIETLVALFVLAIGLLGVIAMQANSVRTNQRAQFSSEVQALAGDFADRIYAYNDVDDVGDDDDYDNLNTDGAVTLPGCLASGCDKAAQRTLDLYEWKDAFNTRLPSGRGTTNFNAALNVYTITVMWDNERTGARGTNCGGDPDVDLACYQMEVAL